MDLFNDFLPNGIKSLESDFTGNPRWKAEITKWLECVYAIDTKYYERAKTRVAQDTLKQEEVFAEIRSIYFLHKCGCTIMALEPNRIDLTFTDTSGIEWYADVKCPSYVKEILDRDMSLAQKATRKQQPKYIDGEASSFDYASHYAGPIEKSVNKFDLGNNNLLIISDNLFNTLNGDPFLKENITTQLSASDPQRKISAVLLLLVECPAFENGFKYEPRVVEISKSISLRPKQNINS